MCDAWVCTLWKAAGVVGDDFQCTETTNWDILALPLFGPVCKGFCSLSKNQKF